MAERQGVVFIATDVHYGSSEVHFGSYWDRKDRGDIEEMPEVRCAAGRYCVGAPPSRRRPDSVRWLWLLVGRAWFDA